MIRMRLKMCGLLYSFTLFTFTFTASVTYYNITICYYFVDKKRSDEAVCILLPVSSEQFAFCTKSRNLYEIKARTHERQSKTSKISVTSIIINNIPTRELLSGETNKSFV